MPHQRAKASSKRGRYRPSEEIQLVSRQSRTYRSSFPLRTGSQTGIIVGKDYREGSPTEAFWATQKTERPKGRRRPRAAAADSRRRREPKNALARGDAGRTSERAARSGPERRFARRASAAAGKRRLTR